MKWLLVALLWGVAVLNYLDRQVVFSLFPLLQRDLGATAFQLGLIGTVFLWTYGLLSPFGGYLADRFGRVRVILGSLLVWSVATWVTGIAGSISTLLWSRFLMGASEAFYLPAALALIADRHGPETRGLATGIHQSGLYTGLILGGAWGGWMGEQVGWRPVFTILGIAGAVYFLVLLVGLRRDKAAGGRSAFGGALGELLRQRGFLLLVAAFTVMSLANWLIYTWLPLLLYERFHLTLAGAGFSATVYIQVASYVAVVAGGALSDHWSRRRPRARIICQGGAMAVMAPFLFLLGFVGSMPLLIVALIWIGIGRGLFDCNTMPILRGIVSARLSATGYGVLNLCGCVAGGAGAAAAGFLKQNVGLGPAFGAAALLMVGGAVALARLPRAAQE